MKNFLSLLALTLPIVTLSAGGKNPPAPLRGPGPPPGLPIDEYLIILFLLGVFIFYKFFNLKKTS